MKHNSSPNIKTFGLDQIGNIADDNLSVAKLIIFVSDREENMGKAENAFSPFPTMFSKAFLCWAVKTRDCLRKC